MVWAGVETNTRITERQRGLFMFKAGEAGARNACSEGLVRGNSELVGAFLNLASNNAKALAPLVAFSCARAPSSFDPRSLRPSPTQFSLPRHVPWRGWFHHPSLSLCLELSNSTEGTTGPEVDCCVLKKIISVSGVARCARFWAGILIIFSLLLQPERRNQHPANPTGGAGSRPVSFRGTNQTHQSTPT